MNKAENLEGNEQPLNNGAITFPVKKEKTIENPNDISYIEADGNYVDVHFKNKMKEIKTTDLKYMMSKLDPAVFVRSGKSEIVNVQRIRKWKYCGREIRLIMMCGKRINVSRYHVKDIEPLLPESRRITTK